MRWRTRDIAALLIAVLFVFMAGCGGIGQALFGPLPEGAIPWEERLPRDKAYAFNAAYNGIAKDYRYQAKMPDLSEAQLDLLKAKWSVMSEVYPLINTYSGVANAGGFPSVESEDAILMFLNQLGARLGRF